ncbi:MAG: GIY-YIG nuclease family protein [candidate division WOR-3 bacterium]
MNDYFVHIIKGRTGDYYVGVTQDIEERIKRHNTQRGSKYTKNKGPFTLVFSEVFPNLSLALKREKQIKSLSRKKKDKLICDFEKK